MSKLLINTSINRGRGRPKKNIALIDNGTPELQKYRQEVLQIIPDYQNKNVNHVLGGSWLHYLNECELISKSHFRAGLAFGRLYSLTFRSFGIRKNLSSISYMWDKGRGRSIDTFEDMHVEKLWAYFCAKLQPHYHNNKPIMNLALDLVCDQSDLPSKIKSTSPELITYTLEQIKLNWKIIEKSALKIGFYN